MNKFAKKPTEEVKPAKAEKPVAASKAAAKPVKAEKPVAAPKAEKPSKAGKDLSAQKITLISKENPKRGGAAERFKLYKSGMTVAEYIAAGGKVQDVAWDSKKGYIKVA